MFTENLDQSNHSRYGINKLNDENYYSWAWDCKLLLQECEVWPVMDGTLKKLEGKDDIAAWEKQNQEAFWIISFTIIAHL